MIDMNESYLAIEDCTVFVRHNDLAGARPTILLIHGLGEPGPSSQEIFENRLFAEVNIESGG